MSTRPRDPGRSGVNRLLNRGWLEIGAAGLLAILAVVLDQVDDQPWQVLALDLAACVAAALATWWPRTAGTALGGVLAVYLAIPAEWATMGEYAPLIPILGAGMRGAARTRTVMTACYGLLLAAIAWRDAPTPASAILGWIVWAALIGVLWLIGNAFRAVIRAQRQTRTADLVLQRQAVARELHDTVARSLTIAIMAAERAKLRERASLDDLERITSAAQNSMRELRLVMNLLRDPPDPETPLSVQHTPLTEALDTGMARLAEHGLTVSTAVQGDISAIPPDAALVLGTATQEAMANIVKHADPSAPCAIVLDVTADAIQLAFINGRLNPADPKADNQGLGIWGMKQRLHDAGGETTVESTPSQWITSIRLPIRTSPTRPEGPSGNASSHHHRADRR